MAFIEFKTKHGDSVYITSFRGKITADALAFDLKQLFKMIT